MRKFDRIIWMFLFTSVSSSIYAFEGLEFSLTAELQSGWLNGGIVNANLESDELASSFFSNADSMGLSRETLPSIYLNMSHAKWNYGLIYAPIKFDGVGTGQAALLTETLGGFVSLPLESTIDTQMLLGSVNYDLIKTDSSSFGFGISAGEADVKFLLDSGIQYNYKERFPIALINLHMMSQYKRFYYGFTLDAFSIKLKNNKESFEDYKIKMAYRLVDANQYVDLVGGWRFQKLKFSISYPESILATDLELRGPLG